MTRIAMEHQKVPQTRTQQQVHSLQEFKTNCQLMQNGLDALGKSLLLSCPRPPPFQPRSARRHLVMNIQTHHILVCARSFLLSLLVQAHRRKTTSPSSRAGLPGSTTAAERQTTGLFSTAPPPHLSRVHYLSCMRIRLLLVRIPVPHVKDLLRP